ncbi:isatin hydrolase-like [Patiria miniata]|uniref:Cyclase n=1 Tax=Patiria miniata TaxID=46514 RepID=A0A914BJ50_PATMI|nr:isatin hydrolase-like [Patiria miniata]
MATHLPKHTTMSPHLTLLGLVLAAGLATALKKGEVLDMTYKYDNVTTLGWPGSTPFELTILQRGPTPSTPWLEGNKFCTAEHFGTHMDAPAHAAKGKWRVDQIPARNLVGPAVRVDVSAKAAANADYQLSPADLTDWVSANGPIPDGALLFVYTGYGAHWTNRLAYYGYAGEDDYLDADGNSLLHFPGISEAAATWLVSNTQVSGVGIDSASLESGQSQVDFAVHEVLLKENIFGMENVANVDLLPTTGATAYALPMKIGDGSGGPVRIVAVLTENADGGSNRLRVDYAALLVVGISIIMKAIL